MARYYTFFYLQAFSIVCLCAAHFCFCYAFTLLGHCSKLQTARIMVVLTPVCSDSCHPGSVPWHREYCTLKLLMDTVSYASGPPLQRSYLEERTRHKLQRFQILSGGKMVSCRPLSFFLSVHFSLRESARIPRYLQARQRCRCATMFLCKPSAWLCGTRNTP